MNPESVAVLIPIVALMIPIVIVLTRHQQKMAELFHQRQTPQPMEIEMLRREVADLRQAVHQQTIQLDNFLQSQAQLHNAPQSSGIADRLGN